MRKYLYRMINNQDTAFEAFVVPQILLPTVLTEVYDNQGYVGTTILYKRVL